MKCTVCGGKLFARESSNSNFICEQGHYVSMSELIARSKLQLDKGWEQYGLE